MSFVRFVYTCFWVLGMVFSALFGAAVGAAFAHGQGNGYLFLFGFSAIAMLTISSVEFAHPVSKPYTWGTPVQEHAA